MATAIRLQHTGGSDVLRVEQVERADPGPREVWLEQEAVGINYLDVMQRKGAVPIPLPGGLGLEGAGRVAAIGAEVVGLEVGDRVGYALGPLGAYASGRLYPADRLVRLPDGVDFDAAAAVIFKGITAQYLIKTTFPVQAGTVVLLYGAAGGVGRILAAWAKHLGATVIGVVSRETSVAAAEAAGCDHVLVWGSSDLAADVARLTDGQKAHVVYDGVGKDTFAASLASLRTRGMLVSIGASSGVPAPVEISALGRSSLFLTRPGLGAYASDPEEYRARVADVFAAVAGGIVPATVGASFPLAEAAEAHAAFESGRANGAVILKP